MNSCSQSSALLAEAVRNAAVQPVRSVGVSARNAAAPVRGTGVAGPSPWSRTGSARRASARGRRRRRARRASPVPQPAAGSRPAGWRRVSYCLADCAGLHGNPPVSPLRRTRGFAVSAAGCSQFRLWRRTMRTAAGGIRRRPCCPTQLEPAAWPRARPWIVAGQERNTAHAICRHYCACRGHGIPPALGINGPLPLWCSTQGKIALAKGNRHWARCNWTGLGGALGRANSTPVVRRIPRRIGTGSQPALTTAGRSLPALHLLAPIADCHTKLPALETHQHAAKFVP